MADDINVTINNLYLFILNLIPSVETHLMFNEATQNNYKLSLDEYYTERRVIPDMIVQADTGSTQQVSSHKCLICAHQTQNRIGAPKNNNNIAIFDNVDLRKYHVEIDGQRYPRDSLLINYEENDYFDQYKDSKLFFKEYIGEPIINPFISYPDSKTKFPIGILGLGHQPDHITSKKINYFKNMARIVILLDCF